MLYTSKEHIFHVEFKFKQKSIGSFLKNLQEIEFFCFLVKNEADQVSSMGNFSIFLKTKLKNGFARGLKLKVTKYELSISNQSEMVDDYLPGGATVAPPPALIRVKSRD